MEVTVTKEDNGTYTVVFDGRTVTLPAGSKRTEEKDGPSVIATKYGTDNDYLRVDTYTYDIEHVQGETITPIITDDDDGEYFNALDNAWRTPRTGDIGDPTGSVPKGGRRKTRKGKKSRKAKKTRRAKKASRTRRQ